MPSNSTNQWSQWTTGRWNRQKSALFLFSPSIFTCFVSFFCFSNSSAKMNIYEWYNFSNNKKYAPKWQQKTLLHIRQNTTNNYTRHTVPSSCTINPGPLSELHLTGVEVELTGALMICLCSHHWPSDITNNTYFLLRDQQKTTFNLIRYIRFTNFDSFQTNTDLIRHGCRQEQAPYQG